MRVKRESGMESGEHLDELLCLKSVQMERCRDRGEGCIGKGWITQIEEKQELTKLLFSHLLLLCRVQFLGLSTIQF